MFEFTIEIWMAGAWHDAEISKRHLNTLDNSLASTIEELNKFWSIRLLQDGKEIETHPWKGYNK